MFDTLKNLNNLRKQADELKKQLESERITVSSSDELITLTLNGSHELIEMKINKSVSQLSNDQITSSFMEAYNKAQKELKNILARKFQGLI